MSLARQEAPKRYMPTNRSGAVERVIYWNSNDNQNDLNFSINPTTNELIFSLIDGNGDVIGGSSIQRWRSNRLGGPGYTTLRSLSVLNGWQGPLNWANVTLTDPKFFGTIQFGNYSDEGGSTIEVTLPTTAEVRTFFSNIPGTSACTWIVQAATNVADQLDILNSDLNVRVNQSGATGTVLYQVIWDYTTAGDVSVSIFQIA